MTCNILYTCSRPGLMGGRVAQECFAGIGRDPGSSPDLAATFFTFLLHTQLQHHKISSMSFNFTPVGYRKT